MGKESKKEKNIEFIYDSGKNKITDPSEISNAMNEYLTNVGKNSADNIQMLTSSKLALPPINEKTMYLHPTNRSEILKIIHRLKLKSGGIDGISAKTLKILAEFIADPLVHPRTSILCHRIVTMYQ